MRKKFFRLSLALFALAVAITAAPKNAMAFGGNCPSGESINTSWGLQDCSLTGPSGDCSNCTYYCPGLLWYYVDPWVTGNFCAD